jgi:hypothetical protein
VELEQPAETTQETPTAHIHGPLNAAMWQNLVANSRVEQPEPPEQTEQEPPEQSEVQAEPVEREN